MIFWSVIVLLIIGALAFVLLPLLKSHDNNRSVAREDINKAIYLGKVEDLEADLDKGLLDQDEYQHALTDLQQTLLQDADTQQPTQTSSSNNIFVTLVLAISLPVMAIMLYKYVSTGEFTNDLSQQQHANTQSQSLEGAIASLQKKLQEDPDNVEGWKMLGQSYFVMQRYEAAKQAYINALELVNQADPELLVLTAESSAFSNNELFAEYEKSLLKKALSINPKFERALWYAGYAAYTSSDYSVAVEHWQSLSELVPADRPQVKQSLNTFLADAREKAGMPAVVEETQDSQQRTINVAVQLNANINQLANSNDTLFIYARPAQGPKMPLSLARMTVASLPIEVTLTKDMSMVPNMTIESFDQIEVLARISKSGQAITQPGDLISQAVKVDFSISNSANVVLDITSVVE